MVSSIDSMMIKKLGGNANTIVVKKKKKPHLSATSVPIRHQKKNYLSSEAVARSLDFSSSIEDQAVNASSGSQSRDDMSWGPGEYLPVKTNKSSVRKSAFYSKNKAGDMYKHQSATIQSADDPETPFSRSYTTHPNGHSNAELVQQHRDVYKHQSPSILSIDGTTPFLRRQPTPSEEYTPPCRGSAQNRDTQEQPLSRNSPTEMDAPLSIFDMFSTLQGDLSKNFEKIDFKLSVLETRMNGLESSQIALEKTVKDTESQIRQLHNSFNEDEKFKSEESITSSHNSKVVKKIVETMQSDVYSESLIRKGCATYRKTLAAKSHGISSPVKHKKTQRSRKQRSYERRGKQLRGSKELAKWKTITADMMSDEEFDETENVYIRHPPAYRSCNLQGFLNELDDRSENKNIKRNRPRIKRIIGQAVDISPPPGVPKWMMRNQIEIEDNEEHIHEQDTMTDASTDLDTDELLNQYM